MSDEYSIHTNFQAGRLTEEGYEHEMNRLEDKRDDAYSLAADMLDPPGGGVETYFDDPVGFVRDCIRWEADEGPTAYQASNLELLVKHKRLAVRGPHSLGKTASNAWLVLWFALTREARGVDWKVITTASAWRQLDKFLWPEIRRKWVPRLRWGTIGRPPFTTDELMLLGLRLAHGEAFAVACDDPATIEGAHADSLMYIYDEAKTIPEETFDATEGAFMGAGADTRAEAFAVASSTPGEPFGRFYDIHARKPGFEPWHVVHVKLEDAIEAHRVSREDAERLRRQFGPDSAMYINRVLGDFATSEADGVIPLSWVEAANERYAKIEDPNAEPISCLGVDVAEYGGDRSVIAIRRGDVLSEIRRIPRADVMVTTGHVMSALVGVERNPPVVVDANAIGAGVAARLREQGTQVIAFKSQEKSNATDITNQFEFGSCRAAAWWTMRDLLNPENGSEVALPPDDGLTSELICPRWSFDSRGKVTVETKDDIRKKLKRSTDAADAVIQAFWTRQRGKARAPFFAEAPYRSKWADLRPGALQGVG